MQQQQQQGTTRNGPYPRDLANGEGGPCDADDCLRSHSQNVLRIVVLGCQAVGKTSLVQQFVYCTAPEAYEPTIRPVVHRPSIAVNERTYDTRLVDCPPLETFPTDSLQEFSNFRGYGLRSATAYVLVYDATDEPSFQYVRRLRSRLLEQGLNVPTLVVANKVDLLDTLRDAKDTSKSKNDASNLVRKQWKCQYAECSAKYNWRVNSAFRELFKAIEQRESGHKAATARVQEALRRNQCSLM